jgi:multiple sugar transport system substrate-binding protein
MKIRSTLRRNALRAAAIVTIATSAGTLAACSSSTPPKTKTTDITFSYLWGGDEAKALQKVIATYNKSQSEVHVTGVSSPDFQKQLTSMSASNGSFDVSDNFGSAVGSWASKGIIAPLDSYLKADGIKLSDFAPSALTEMKYQGKVYAMPIAVHTQELLYNKDLFAAAGISGPPKTFSEFASDIAKLTKTDASGNITQLGLGDPSTATLLTALGYAFGGTWDGKDGATPSPDNAANVKALNWYQQNVVNKYGAAKLAAFESGLGTYMSAQDPFYQGKEAMVLDGEWQAVNIPTTAPNLNWGVVSLPAYKSSLKDSTEVSTSTLFIPSNSKHKAAAAKFIAYMMGDKAMTAFTLALGNLPSRTDLLNSSDYNKIPEFSVWLKALNSKNARAMSSAPYSAQYSTDLGAAFDDITRGAATPEAAMKSVAQKASSYDAG